MEKVTVKGFFSVFPNPKLILAMILLAAIVCVLSYIAGTSYANADSRINLLSSTTIIKTDAVNQPTSNDPGTKAEPEQARLNSSVSESLTDSEGDIKRNIRPLETSGYSGEWQTIQMRVTAYCPCRKCCGKYSDGITACGHKIRPGDSFVAADKKYPFGTEMIIAGYKGGKPVKVLDRGGVIRGNRLDVFFDSHEEAVKWGVRNLDVKVRHK